jgi:diguanylate cyclase (GGDEF)-like protein
MAKPEDTKQPLEYDPQKLLDTQPVIITVIDPFTHKAIFQNQSSREKFGDLSGLTCHEKIANCPTPCSFCKMPEAVETGNVMTSEVALPDNVHLLVQWGKVVAQDGRTHVVETITDITELKRQQERTDKLNQQLQGSLRELYHLNQQLKESSIRDGLTGLYNHSYCQDLLMKLCAEAQRADGQISLLFLDLDNFKSINDTYGHAAGDQVLREMGWLLDSKEPAVRNRRLGRPSDIGARYGGEEFVVILPNTPLDGALIVAERLRHRVTTLMLLPELATIASPPFPLTCSVGVATFPTHASCPSDLIAAADAAASTAKKTGKNRVCVFNVEEAAA